MSRCRVGRGGALKTRVLLLLASYIEHLAEEIAWEQNGVGEQPVPSNVEVLYATIPFLAEIGSDGKAVFTRAPLPGSERRPANRHRARRRRG